MLSILRSPPGMPPETRSFAGGEISLGRSYDNDWVLNDPDKHLSKRHCLIAFHDGDWQVADTSTNGTFVNGDAEPLGQGPPRRLRDGDRLRFGAYEIEARIVATERPAPPWSNPFGREQPSAAEYRPAPASPGIRLPANFDPTCPDDDLGTKPLGEFGYPTQSDHVPAVNEAFRPPRVVSLIPDGWADDPVPGLQLAPAPVSPAAPLPEPPVAPQTPPPPRSEPGGAALLAAFLEGAGIKDAKIEDPEAMMRQMGAALRAMVSGLRQILIARAAIKGEFRIERTLMASEGNNPLKIATDDDDAMAALAGARRRADLPASRAVVDALQDVKMHELATIAAMQSAVRALVAEFDPARLRQETAGVLPAFGKTRAWDAFEALHKSVSRSLADDFDSVFGKNFARAYERAQDDLSAKAAYGR